MKMWRGAQRGHNSFALLDCHYDSGQNDRHQHSGCFWKTEFATHKKPPGWNWQPNWGGPYRSQMFLKCSSQQPGCLAQAEKNPRDLILGGCFGVYVPEDRNHLLSELMAM